MCDVGALEKVLFVSGLMESQGCDYNMFMSLSHGEVVLMYLLNQKRCFLKKKAVIMGVLLC